MSRDYLFTLELYDRPEGKKVGEFLAMDINEERGPLITIPLENENHRNREGLHIKNENQRQYFIKDLVKEDMYRNIQSSVFDKEGQSSFIVHSHNLNMSIDDFVKQFSKENQGEELLKGNDEKQHDKNTGLNDIQHSIRLTSFEPNSLIDSDSLAQLVVTNAINGKEHVSEIWADNAEKREFEPYYLYLNNPIQNDYTDYNDKKMADILNDSLYSTTLFDVVQHDEKVVKAIERYYDSGESFSIEFPKEQQIMNLHSIVVDEEITDLMIKADEGLLAKKDIIDFGKLVQNDTDLFDSNIEFLGYQFEKVLEKDPLTKDEMKFADKTFEALNINMKANDFSISKENSKFQSIIAKDEEISR